MGIAENQHNLNVQIYQLTKDLLFDSFAIEANLFRPPLTNYDTFDHGIRQMMWPGFADRPVTGAVANIMDKPFYIALLKSNLGFYNMVVTLPNGDDIEVITLGPFRAQDTTAKYYEQILKDAHIPAERLNQAQSVFRELPKANPDSVSRMVKRICAEYYRQFDGVEIKSISFLDEKHKTELVDSQLNKRLYENALSLKKMAEDFSHALLLGDINESRKIIHENFNDISLQGQGDILNLKNNVHLLNGFAATKLLETSIHPYRIIELYKQFSVSIDDCTDAMMLSLIPYDISHKYCLLVRNHTYDNCSMLIKNVINYILLNLDEDLSLSVLAAKFNRNKTSLSATFHREVGQTLTDFVNTAKVNEAIRLLNTTNASISDIALAVGFTDFAVFSRTFKKVTGSSPRSYKNKL